jgi:hypothetical protein
LSRCGPSRLFRGIATLEVEIADASLDAIGRLRKQIANFEAQTEAAAFTDLPQGACQRRPSLNVATSIGRMSKRLTRVTLKQPFSGFKSQVLV